MFDDATALQLDARTEPAVGFIGLVLRTADDRFALIEPARSDRGQRTTFPKTAITPGERASTALARCVREQLGVIPARLQTLPGPWETDGDVSRFFLGALDHDAPEGAPPPSPHGHTLHWCDRLRAAELLLRSEREADRARDLQLLALAWGREPSPERRLLFAVQTLHRMGFEALRLTITDAATGAWSLDVARPAQHHAPLTGRITPNGSPIDWDDATFDAPRTLADRLLYRAPELVLAARRSDPPSVEHLARQLASKPLTATARAALPPLRFSDAPPVPPRPAAPLAPSASPAPVASPAPAVVVEPPRETASPKLLRARGVVLGLAVGDALGAPIEILRRDAPPHPALLDGPVRDMIGGGKHDLAPGQVSDDTHMACCLATSLRARRRLDLDDVARRYVAWMGVTFDVGAQIRTVLTKIAAGERPHAAAMSVWEAGRRERATNGSLMRTAPLALHLAHDAEALMQASLDESALTHFDPRCRVACAAFNATLARAVCDGAPVDALFTTARSTVVDAARALLKQTPRYAREIQMAKAALLNDLDAARRDDPSLYGPELHLLDRGGFVRVAFRLAFWELAHAPSYEAALLDVVNRGGDADANATITGALLGAHHGAEAIPARWADAVRLAMEDRDDSPYATAYHPRVLFALAEERFDPR